MTTSAGTILESSATRTVAITFDQLDDHGVELIRTAVVDTLGVAIAVADFDGSAILRAASVGGAGTGPSLVLGTSERVPAIDAGMLNGMAAHALDYDDGNIVLVGHPSTLLVPAVLALGEEVDASLEDIAVVYAAGFQVIIGVSRGVNTAHYEKGWHPTSTIGVLGVAAAGARLLGLDAAGTTVALAVACSMASGIKANFGTMVEAFHVGQAVRNGLLAAELAAAGFTANPSAMEAAQGWLSVYNGVGTYDAEAIVAGPGDPLEVNRGFNPIKVYPCCASTHSGVRAALDLRAAHDLRPADVAAARVVVDAKRMRHTDRPILAEALSGKFSAQYVVARALIDGKVGLADFEGDAHLDPASLSLMAKVEVVAAPPGGPDNSFAADVTVTTTSGEKLRTVVDPGADPSLMAGSQQLWAKFEDCTGQVLSPAAVQCLAAALHAFPTGPNVRALTALTDRATGGAGPLVGAGRAS